MHSRYCRISTRLRKTYARDFSSDLLDSPPLVALACRRYERGIAEDQGCLTDSWRALSQMAKWGGNCLLYTSDAADDM
eukprot:2596106-Rhodomonas_salina.3